MRMKLVSDRLFRHAVLRLLVEAALAAFVAWALYAGWEAAQAACDWEGERADMEWAVLLAFLVLVVITLSSVVCQLVVTVRGIRCSRWWVLITSWLLWLVSSMVQGAAVLVVLMMWLGGGPDSYAEKLNLPEGREYVMPRGMTGDDVVDDARAVRVRELGTLRAQSDVEVGQLLVPGERAHVPNLEKLAQSAPEVLHEYLLRCLYAEAVNARFISPFLFADGCLYPVHEHTPEALRLRVEFWADDSRMQELGNGWKLCSRRHSLNASVPQKAVERLEAALAPLAQNPTRQQLDAMLPPLPKSPFLSLWKDFSCDKTGDPAYGALLVIPADYPEGTFTLKAYEITQRKPVRFGYTLAAPEALGDVCRAMAWDMSVYSGREGEYYASEWEIWFTPADGGEARCVATQEFLMMGY